jgi:hypothetical protein
MNLWRSPVIAPCQAQRYTADADRKKLADSGESQNAVLNLPPLRVFNRFNRGLTY